MKLNINHITIIRDKKKVIQRMSFSVQANETVVLFGPSGCGKTSILKAILGVLPYQGSIQLNHNPLPDPSIHVGMVIQGPVIPTWLKLEKLCALAQQKKENHEHNHHMLQAFGIEEYSHTYPEHMSGGQKQRAALALTLLHKPDVLLLDEPTSALDGMTRLNIWKYIEHEIQPLKIPTILVSHDPTEAILLGDRILMLSNQGNIEKEVFVPFKHPRNEKTQMDPLFFDIKKKIVNIDPKKTSEMI